MTCEVERQRRMQVPASRRRSRSLSPAAVAGDDRRCPRPRPDASCANAVVENRARAVRRSRPSPIAARCPRRTSPSSTWTDGERRGHTSPRGGIYWEDKTYSDQRVLLHIPKGFDPRRPALMIVFFHGNEATLARDVRDRQQVPRQVAESGLNAVLVAPQFAVERARFERRAVLGAGRVRAISRRGRRAPGAALRRCARARRVRQRCRW